MEDSELIAQVRGGNIQLFGQLIERYQRLLYYFVAGKFRDPAASQDIVQKSFVTAYRGLHTLADADAFFPWVKGIALNHCRNEWRSYQRQATLKERLLEARRAELEILRLDKPGIGDDGRLHALHECLQTLSPEEQALVERRFVQESTMEEIGRELDKGGEAVRLWLYRIRLRLSECIKRRLSLDPDAGIV